MEFLPTTKNLLKLGFFRRWLFANVKPIFFKFYHLLRNHLPFTSESNLKSFQVEFGAILSLGYAVQERAALHCWSQLATFLAQFPSGGIHRQEIKLSLRSVWNAFGSLGSCNQGTGAALVGPILKLFILIFHAWKENHLIRIQVFLNMACAKCTIGQKFTLKFFVFAFSPKVVAELV